jgi:hypothetical protein
VLYLAPYLDRNDSPQEMMPQIKDLLKQVTIEFVKRFPPQVMPATPQNEGSPEADAATRALRRFGFVDPILVDRGLFGGGWAAEAAKDPHIVYRYLKRRRQSHSEEPEGPRGSNRIKTSRPARLEGDENPTTPNNAQDPLFLDQDSPTGCEARWNREVN